MYAKRREFLKSSVAAGAAVCVSGVRAADRPVLTVGMMSDTHITRDRKSVERTRRAMELFKKLNVDVMAHLGDLADWHYPEAYAYYRETLDAVFPPGGRRPELLYAFGNHDALDPSRQNGPRAKRQSDRRQAFADMKERLGIDHGYVDLKVIAGYPFLIFPETFDDAFGLDDYERKLAETCAKFPEGPVFVLMHPPLFQTTYNSCFQDPPRRKVTDRFPRVVSINGHKHASIKNELCIWQGEFTALQVSCLQKWYGLNVGSRIVGKESWGVGVMEIYRDRLVVRRYDVRDGSEYRPDAPWTVRLPYEASAAPYAVAKRAQSETVPAFPANAAIGVAVDAKPFSVATVRFGTVTDAERVFLYRVEVFRKSAAGAWDCFSSAEVFGDFYELKGNRKSALECSFSSALFEAGAAYRFTVTPIGFFGKAGAPLVADWRAPEKAPVEIVWSCDAPMAELKPSGNAKVVREGDWFVCGFGVFRFDPPRGIFTGGKKGDTYRFVVEMQSVQANVPHGVQFGVERPSWAGGLLTPVGDSGVRRYVLTEKLRRENPDWAFKFAGVGNLKIRFLKMLIERC